MYSVLGRQQFQLLMKATAHVIRFSDYWTLCFWIDDTSFSWSYLLSYSSKATRPAGGQGRQKLSPLQTPPKLQVLTSCEDATQDSFSILLIAL